MCFNNLLQMAYVTATTWKCLGKKHSRTLHRRTPKTFYEMDCTRLARIAKVSSKAPTGVKIDHADRGVKAGAQKSTFQCSTV